MTVYIVIDETGDCAVGLVTEKQKLMLESLPECYFQFESVMDLTRDDDETVITNLWTVEADEILAAKREREDMRDFCTCGELRHRGPCTE